MLNYVVLITIVLLCALAGILYISLDKKKKYRDLKSKHVVITGGSSGIGKSAASEVAKLGADVTIIGRDLQKLQEAVNEIKEECKDRQKQKVQYLVLDVTSKYDVIQKSLASMESEIGPIFMLINCAGTCICGEFENAKSDDIKYLLDLNYFGTAYPTRYVLPGMKQRNEGLVVFVASEAALIGIYGYSAYSAAKWAVRGLAESIFMELVGTNVRLTLAFPPDTDTPGFEKEEQTKPLETKLISASGGLHTPSEVAHHIVIDALDGKKYSVCGITGKIMCLLYCTTLDSVTQVILQVLSMGMLRAIMACVTLSFHKIVRDGLQRKEIEAMEDAKEE